ncbi:MAG: hypothetical protein U0L05_03260 [Schaedlerella sp.]|nr:hypothetical protein [Schaedlerella sp.]
MKVKNILNLIIILILVAIFIENQNPIPGLSEGIYAIQGKNSMPQIQFELTQNVDTEYGSFCYSVGNMQILQGTYEIKKGYVIGTSRNNGEKYIFEIKDNDTIIFKSKKSSELYWLDGVTQIKDGTEFIYIDNCYETSSFR